MSHLTKSLVELLPHEGPAANVPYPPRRWISRVLVPIAILGGTALLLVYAAGISLQQVADVWVVPVVAAPTARTADASTSAPAEMDRAIKTGAAHGQLLVQAPGWIEPAPYAFGVPALTDGVVQEILVTEGDHVEAGQVVARLIREDAELQAQAADAYLDVLRAELMKAQAEAQEVEFEAAEIEDRLDRAKRLAQSGGGSEAEAAQLAIRHQGAKLAAKAMQAAAAAAEAEVRRQEILCRQAQLAVTRTDVITPAAGVVMSLLVHPGARISAMAGGSPAVEPMNAQILKLYDPAKLQVRVDVPLSDFAKLRVGAPAEVTTEALPDVAFSGRLTHVVHEANIQRNTVPVKVSIENPDNVLKPEMLARVRFFRSQEPADAVESESAGPSEPGPLTDWRLLIDPSALQERNGNKARVWLVSFDASHGRMIASRREITVAPGEGAGFVEVSAGLQPGDRAVVDPPAELVEGQPVRVLGEKPMSKP